MKVEDIRNKFLAGSYHSLDTINMELNLLHDRVRKSIKNNYENLLYSNGRSEWLKTLSIEELFLMNMHDKHILGILNISIYEAIVNANNEILYNGIFTYNRLRNLNRLHLSGSGIHCRIERLIYNDDLLKENHHTEYLLEQFNEFSDGSSGKFDMAFVQLLESLIRGDNNEETNFNNLLKLHSKCQWLTKGWYRECNLINYMPIYLIGIYRLINKKFTIETRNEWLIGFINYLENNTFRENKLVYTFTGTVDFLNDILDKQYDEFQREYNSKCN